jgi:hypothetical protein
MKNTLVALVVFAVGVASGRLFVSAPPRAQAGGAGQSPPCQDVNGDGSADISDAAFLLNYLFLGDPEPVCPTSEREIARLPETGQRTCYTADGTAISCDLATCPDQDAVHSTGCPARGRFVDHGDGTVTDTCTGLVWQKDSADVNGDGQADDITWCQALAYCRDLDLAGHDDWRLPNVRELASLVDYGIDYGTGVPAADPVFSTLRSVRSAYWTSTTDAGFPQGAWLVFFYDGGVLVDVEGNTHAVRAVRP